MAEETIVGVNLDPETRDRLNTLGAVKERSLEQLVREAITQYLDREEAIERERQITLERWERYERTGEFVDDATVCEWIDRQIRSPSILPFNNDLKLRD